MKKRFLLIFILLFLIINVSALTVQIDTSVDLVHPIRLDDYPSNGIYCNISLFDPDNIELVDFAPMTNQFEKHNYTVDAVNNSKLGNYIYDVTCTTGLSNKTESFEYEVTTTGGDFSIAQSVVYVIFLIAIIGAFCLSLYGSIKIPFRNQRADDGRIINVNDLKYLKIFSIVISYILLMFAFGVTRSILANYLYLGGAHTVFTWLYWLLFSFLWPLIVISLLLTVVYYLQGLKISEALERGVPIR